MPPLDYDDVHTIDLSHDLENDYDESYNDDYNDDQHGTLALIDEVIEREVIERSKLDAAEREMQELRQLGSTSTSSRDHITLNIPPQAPVTTSSTSTNANSISTSTTNNPPADIVRNHRATFLSNFENQQKKLPSIPEEEIEIVATPANKRQCLRQDTPHPQPTELRHSSRKNKGKRKERDPDDEEKDNNKRRKRDDHE